MALSTAADKLLAWFGIYKLSPTTYSNRLATHPHATRHGVFASALTELTDYETTYGYFTF